MQTRIRPGFFLAYQIFFHVTLSACKNQIFITLAFFKWTFGIPNIPIINYLEEMKISMQDIYFGERCYFKMLLYAENVIVTAFE